MICLCKTELLNPKHWFKYSKIILTDTDQLHKILKTYLQYQLIIDDYIFSP